MVAHRQQPLDQPGDHTELLAQDEFEQVHDRQRLLLKAMSAESHRLTTALETLASLMQERPSRAAADGEARPSTPDFSTSDDL